MINKIIILYNYYFSNEKIYRDMRALNRNLSIRKREYPWL